jgi:hypothetical protein
MCYVDKSYTTSPKKRNVLCTSLLSKIEGQLINPDFEVLPPVDPTSLENPYSLDVWRNFFAFLVERLAADKCLNVDERRGLLPYQFKGGRYGMAVELKSSANNSELQNLSLGELCHVVQLAINGRLLAYEKRLTFFFDKFDHNTFDKSVSFNLSHRARNYLVYYFV